MTNEPRIWSDTPPTTPWSDVPPSEPGFYWVRYKETDDEFALWFNHESKRWWFNDDNEFRFQKYCEFGPRVLTAEEMVGLTAEVERLRAENEELRDRLGLANRVIANPTKVAIE